MTATDVAEERGMLAPLRGRDFRYQFGAQTISTVGSTLSPVALTMGILALTGSAEMLGVVLTAYTVPLVIFVLAGGVWADRVPRRQLMVIADVVRACAQTSVGILLLVGTAPVWVIAALQFITGTATAFYYPASTGLTTSTVRPDQLQKANALLSLSMSVAGTVGPLCASLLVLTAGAGWALIIDGLSFAGSAYLMSRLSSARRENSGVERHFFRELAEGFAEVRRRTWVWSSIIAFAASNLAMATLFVVGPTVLLEHKNGILQWGVIVAVIAVGEVIGDVLALRLRPRRMLLTARMVELGQIPLLIALAVVAPMPWLLMGAVLWGIAMTYPDSLWYTALQQHLPEQAISRVASYDWMGSLMLRPVGYAVAAFIAAGDGLVYGLVGAALLVAVTRGVGVLEPATRNLRRLEVDAS